MCVVKDWGNNLNDQFSIDCRGWCEILNDEMLQRGSEHSRFCCCTVPVAHVPSINVVHPCMSHGTCELLHQPFGLDGDNVHVSSNRLVDQISYYCHPSRCIVILI
jgi:hypothetical protein